MGSTVTRVSARVVGQATSRVSLSTPSVPLTWLATSVSFTRAGAIDPAEDHGRWQKCEPSLVSPARLFTAHATLTVRATVEAVAEAIHPPGATLADLQTLAALLIEAIRAAAPAERVTEQVEAQVPCSDRSGGSSRERGPDHADRSHGGGDRLLQSGLTIATSKDSGSAAARQDQGT